MAYYQLNQSGPEVQRAMMPEDKRFFREFAELLLLLAALSAFMFFSGMRYERRNDADIVTSRCDTVVRVVTQYKDFPASKETAISGLVSVPLYKFISDTVERVETAEIRIHDTTVVYLPREQKYYEESDGRLRLWVSGYEPRLDRWELDEQQTTITQTVVERRSRWSIGLTAGYGASVAGGSVRMSPYVGVGVSYSLIQF